MLPTRERIVRKAKERAVESLHEITSGYQQKQHNTSSQSNNSTLNNSNQANETIKTKRTNRSYKPFPESQNQQSENEDQSDTELETPKKATATRTRRKNTTSVSNVQKNQSNAFATAKSRQLASRAGNTNANLDLLSDANDSTNLLFNQILSGQVSTQSIVDDWIELYKRDKDTAMLDLIKFIVRSAGCKSSHLLNSKEILRTKEFTESINELIEQFTDNDDDSSIESYPLVQNSLQARRFKSNFCEFLQLLINQCQYSIIYDQFMLDILITFLIALADSQVRAFRHTATLAVLKIMTALVDVLLALSIAKDACQRQFDNERQKTQAKRATDRMEMLQAKRKELEENEYEIQNFINFIFKAVFIHRYRDICADIRCVCINEIGEWMRKCPAKFLDDTFLKYIGWTLYDKMGECRLKCLQALHPLYEQIDLLSRLELFTSRFKTRIVEMSLDKEQDVAVAAIRLLTLIVSQNDAALEDKDCENIYELVYHTNRQIAQAAGEFLNKKLFVKIEMPQIEFKRGKKQSENSTFIHLLVQFLIESELHDHPTYLVDAMWDIHPMLKDWECMTDLLLEDPLNSQDALEDVNERYIIEIMFCCVKQAATGEYPIARRGGTNSQLTQRKLTAKENKQASDDRAELTQHFMHTLPSLLTKYIADADKLVFLLQLPNYFDLSQYTQRRQEKCLERLLKCLEEIVNKHNDANVLAECSKALAYLCDEELAIYIKANLSRSSVLDELVNAFNKAMKQFEQLSEVDENEMYPLLIALKRLAAFAENHNIVNYDLVNNTFTILRWAIFNEGFGHEFVNGAINLARSIITWNLHKLNAEIEESKQSSNSEEDVEYNKDLIGYIAKLAKKFYKLCNKLFVNENPQIEEEAYFEICDLLILFSANLTQQHKEFKNLILECETNEINMLTVYVMKNVFTDDVINEKADTTEKIEKLHKRRCILAAFCKLISYNCVPVIHAAEILRGYIKYANSYSDIIKMLLTHCKEISKVNAARTIALALQREYSAALEAYKNKTMDSSQQSNQTTNAHLLYKIDRTSPEFITLKELVHRFCLSFGPDASTKSREAILSIHQEALLFANSEPSQSVSQGPPNLLFLEVIVEFSSRLTPQDKRIMLNELDKLFAKRANKIEDNNWHAYYAYRISLMEDQSSSHNNQTTAANQTNQLANATTTSLNNQTNLLSKAGPSAIGSSSSADPASSTVTNNSLIKLKRKNQQPPNVSVINSLKDTMNRNRLAELDEEEEDYEDQVENIINDHADSAVNDLDNLKLDQNGGSTSGGHRVTRSAKTPPTLIKTTNNKRSRSPLVSNNSINESIDIQNSVLSSTRIDAHKTNKTKQTNSNLYASAISKTSISLNPIRSGNLNNDNLNDSSDHDDSMLNTTPSKRKRRSEDTEKDKNHLSLSNQNLRERNTNNALIV